MTADHNAAGAASRAEEGWHTINWKSAFRIVCRLQARIVKAIQLTVGKPRPARDV
jgi:hypothetical protein